MQAKIQTMSKELSQPNPNPNPTPNPSSSHKELESNLKDEITKTQSAIVATLHSTRQLVCQALATTHALPYICYTKIHTHMRVQTHGIFT